MPDPDLRTTYLGLDLVSPVVASSSPVTGDPDRLRRVEAAGAGAVVLPSLFEEQIVHEALEVDRMLSTGAEAFGEAAGYFPELDTYNTGPDRYLTELEAARAALGIPVIASLSATSAGSWVHYAKLLESAGAQALELNVYVVAADPTVTGAEVEDHLVELIADVSGALDVPVAVKLGPYYSSLAHLAGRLVAAGAAGLVLFNRFYGPDLDLDTLEVVPTLALSEPNELRLPLRWIALLAGRVDASLAATTGIHDAAAVAKVLLAGADVAMMASALLHAGPEHVAVVLDGLRAWMAEHEYESVAQLKGSASQQGVPDPGAYERANYLHALTSYSSTF